MVKFKSQCFIGKSSKKLFTAPPILVITSDYLNTSFSIKHLVDIDPDVSKTKTIASVGSLLESLTVSKVYN